MRSLLLLLAVLSVPAAAQDSPFSWKFQPVPGTKWTLRERMVTSTHVPLSAKSDRENDKLGLTLDQEMVCDYDVLSRDKSGNSAIQLKFRRFESIAKVRRQAPKEQNNLPDNRGASLGTDVVGSPVVLTVSPQGKIMGIAGLEEFGKKLLEKSKSLSPMGRAALFPLRMATRNPKTFENMLGWDGNLPNKPLKIGDQYTFEWTAPAGMITGPGVHFTRKLTVRSAGKSTFQESGNSSFRSPHRIRKSTDPWMLNLSVDNKMNGTVVVEEKTGLIRESKLTIFKAAVMNVPSKSNPKGETSKMMGTALIQTSLTPRK